MIANHEYMTKEIIHFHPVAAVSRTLKRVCNSTVQCETYNISTAIEQGDIIRAAIADCHGMIKDMKTWETDAAAFMQHLWFSDCDSTVTALTKRFPVQDTTKRLEIEFSILRQHLWRTKGQAVGDPTWEDNIPDQKDATDVIKWIDTDCMLCDPLTKAMSTLKMCEALDTNTWDIRQPVDSILKKRLKQIGRRKTPVDNEDIRDLTEDAEECEEADD